jgi:DNA-binding NarL/FixJ family response regulator
MYVRRILSAVKSQTSYADLIATDALTDREVQVLRLLAHGASNQEIAQLLVIGVGTVKSHMNHIMSKLDVRNRTEAVAVARSDGLVD